MEETLIKKAIARDAGAIEALYDRYAPALLSVCFRYCGNRDDAEDILHDGFIKIIQKIQTFKIRPDGSLEAWMKRIMINAALNFLRDHAREKKEVDLDAIQERLQIQEENTDFDLAHLPVTQDQILRLIGELPDGYRTVFNLYVFEDYSHKEICRQLNCSESTSKSQLSKARAVLRSKICETVNILNTR